METEALGMDQIVVMNQHQLDHRGKTRPSFEWTRLTTPQPRNEGA